MLLSFVSHEVYGCKVDKYASVAELRSSLSQLTGIPKEHLVFGEVWTNKVSQYINDKFTMSDIHANDQIVAWEVPELVQINFQAPHLFLTQVCRRHSILRIKRPFFCLPAVALFS